MKKYIDASKIRLTAVGTVDEDGDILVSVRDVKKAIDQTPAADVVPKSEIASEIFAEIEKLHLHITNEFDLRRYNELKKKYTGAQVRECVKITLNP